MAKERFFIDSDNLIKLNTLTDQSTGLTVGSANVVMSLYKAFPIKNEKQTVTLTGAVSGTFVLELDEYITQGIPFDASAQQIIDQMTSANPNLSAGDFVASSVNRDLGSAQAGNAVSFSFDSAQASKAQNLMTIDVSNILPANDSVSGAIALVTQGRGDVLSGASGIVLDYDGSGNYSGVIPNTVSMTENSTYYLVVTATSGSSTLKSVKSYPAVYHGKERNV